jgi:hypothetical protein
MKPANPRILTINGGSSALGLGAANEEGNSNQATKFIARLNPSSARSPPYSETAPAGVVGALAPVQIGVKPISVYKLSAQRQQ